MANTWMISWLLQHHNKPLLLASSVCKSRNNFSKIFHCFLKTLSVAPGTKIQKYLQVVLNKHKELIHPTPALFHTQRDLHPFVVGWLPLRRWLWDWAWLQNLLPSCSERQGGPSTSIHAVLYLQPALLSGWRGCSDRREEAPQASLQGCSLKLSRVSTKTESILSIPEYLCPCVLVSWRL